MGKFDIKHLAVMCLVVVGAGCGGPAGPDVASVTGTVKLDGKPLPDAQVTFIPLDGTGGRPGTATTDGNGRYVLHFSEGREGAIPGKNRVQITTGRSSGEDADGNPVAAVPEKVPMTYNSKTTLEFVVEPAKENIADFDLKSGGPVRPVD